MIDSDLIDHPLTALLGRSNHWRRWWGNPRYEWLHDHREQLYRLESAVSVSRWFARLRCVRHGHVYTWEGYDENGRDIEWCDRCFCNWKSTWPRPDEPA